MSCMSLSACSSMSAICLFASFWPSGDSDLMYSRISMVPVTPTLRRISGKFMQGTVSVPSCRLEVVSVRLGGELWREKYQISSDHVTYHIKYDTSYDP